MSLVLRRTYTKVKTNVFSPICTNFIVNNVLARKYGDEKYPEYSSSTILVENGFAVQELPLIVRKVKDLDEMPEAELKMDDSKEQQDSNNYNLIQSEFNECIALRDVFTLLSKCIKITPNIALGAMERIYDLEKNPHALDKTSNYKTLAKDAIIDKLLKVVMKSKDTQTILNALHSVSSFIEPYKNQFCNEILYRVSENKLSIDQILIFMSFLVKNKSNPMYFTMIDKLWIGLFERENEINETNIGVIFTMWPHFRDSKKTVLHLLQQKLSELWYKIKKPEMQEILNTFTRENCWCPQSYAIVGGWLLTNIQSLDEDSLLEIVTNFTKLRYTDENIEKCIEKYVSKRGAKIESPILIVGILNYCMQFQIRNAHILNGCSKYIERKGQSVPSSFIKCTVYPYGFLYYDSEKLWTAVENLLQDKFEKITITDAASMILSFIYVGRFPIGMVNKIFTAECMLKMNNDEQLKGLMHQIDTAMALECKEYLGPMLPKDQWSKAIIQDGRIKKIINLIHDSLLEVAGGVDKLSNAVFIPHLHSNETYLIDVMIHPVGLGSNNFNWKSKSAKDENIAVLIHLPEHYCSDNQQLIGPQEMRKRHLRLLGMKVVSLRYSTLCKYQINKNKIELEKYLSDCIEDAQLSH